MERTVNMGGMECRLKASAALPRLYRQLLGRDVFADVGAILALFMPAEQPEEEGRLRLEIREVSPEQIRGLNLVEDLTYAMHKHADPAQPDNVEAWLEQFDDPGAVFDVLGDVLELWFSDNKTTAAAQKKTGR